MWGSADQSSRCLLSKQTYWEKKSLEHRLLIHIFIYSCDLLNCKKMVIGDDGYSPDQHNGTPCCRNQCDHHHHHAGHCLARVEGLHRIWSRGQSPAYVTHHSHHSRHLFHHSRHSHHSQHLFHHLFHHSHHPFHHSHPLIHHSHHLIHHFHHQFNTKGLCQPGTKKLPFSSEEVGFFLFGILGQFQPISPHYIMAITWWLVEWWTS